MSSAFQLSSAYRPYRSPIDASTSIVGMATRTAATRSFPGQPRGERGRVTSQQRPQGPAPDQGLERRQQQHPEQQETDEPRAPAAEPSTSQRR